MFYDMSPTQRFILILILIIAIFSLAAYERHLNNGKPALSIQFGGKSETTSTETLKTPE